MYGCVCIFGSGSCGESLFTPVDASGWYGVGKEMMIADESF